MLLKEQNDPRETLNNIFESLMDMNESKLMTNAAFIFPKSPEVKEELYDVSYFNLIKS